VKPEWQNTELPFNASEQEVSLSAILFFYFSTAVGFAWCAFVLSAPHLASPSGEE